MATMRELVAAEVRAAIARAGYTPNSFCKRFGFEQTWLSRRLKLNATLTFNVEELDKIARALEISVLDLMPSRESAASAGAGSGPPPRYRPVSDEDPDDGPVSAPYSQPALRTPADQPKDVTVLSGRSAEVTRPPSGPRSSATNRTAGPASRRPRVNARLAGARS